MKHNRMWTVALIGVAALFLAPAGASAQLRIGIGNPYYSYGYYGYYPATSYFYPSYYSYGYYPYGWSYAPGYYAAYYPSYNYGALGLYPSFTGTDYYSTPVRSYSYAASGDTSGYYSAATPDANTVKLNVRVPDPDAQVWVEGQLTRQRGTSREYVSSAPINPDRNYVYQVRARFVQDGRTVDETKTVPVRANETRTVDFTRPNNYSRIDEINPK